MGCSRSYLPNSQPKDGFFIRYLIDSKCNTDKQISNQTKSLAAQGEPTFSSFLGKKKNLSRGLHKPEAVSSSEQRF